MKKAKNLLTKTGKLLLVFSIIFSQLSFPLSVLADESASDVTNEDSEEILLTNNTDGETTDEQANTTSEEQDDTTNENEEETDSETGELPNEEENTPEDEEVIEEAPDFTVELIKTEEQKLYIIKNNKQNATLTVKQIKEDNTDIMVVIDAEGNEITDEETIILSQYQVKITTITEDENAEEVENSTTYTVIMLGDYNNDGMITVEDREVLLELSKTELEEEYLNANMPSLDLNKDEIFNVLDVTYPIFTEGAWENEIVATDELENYLMASVEEVYLEDEKEIEVDYYVKGFDIDSLVGIQGTLSYDETLLELTKIEVNETEQDVEELVNGKFIYLLENYNQDGVLMTFTFKALTIGTPVVSVEDIVASIGGVAANLDVEKASTTLNVLEYGKGGDEEDNESAETTTPSTEDIVEDTEVVEIKPTYVALSTDNDVKSLTIEGYDIAFDPNTYEYTIKVGSDVTSLEISALLSSNKAIYYVEGNENFEAGENLVYVVVKAENGSTKTYTIRVEKEKEAVVSEKNDTKDDKEDKDTEEEKSSSKTVIIILIILVIIGLIYVIFKDDEEDKQESKKETPKETKKEAEKTVKKDNQKNNKKGSKK